MTNDSLAFRNTDSLMKEISPGARATKFSNESEYEQSP